MELTLKCHKHNNHKEKETEKLQAIQAITMYDMENNYK